MTANSALELGGRELAPFQELYSVRQRKSESLMEGKIPLYIRISVWIEFQLVQRMVIFSATLVM
jgi:hypothetical protein